MKRAFLFILAAATALVACNKNEVTTPEQGGREIRFTSNFSTYTVTKAASVLDGKTVKIFAGAPIDASTTAEASDSKLTPATTLYWNKDQTEKTTFASVYPADAASATSITYSVSNGDFAYHSAVLTAAAKDVTPGSTVNFTYKHPFSMLKVTVTNNLEGTPAISGVTVRDLRWEGTLDIVEGTVSNLGTDAVVDATLDNGKYCLVLLPQTAKPSISVSVGDATAAKTYKFVITSDVTFEANKFYNVTLVLDESTPPVVQGEEVAFGFTVADWEEATDAIPVLNVTDVWSVIGEVNDSDWSEDFDMTYDANTGICTITGVTFKTGTNGFKLRKSHDWNVNAGLKEGVSTYGDAAWDGHLTQGGGNIQLSEAGVYTLTFKPEDYTFTATKTGDVTVDPTTAPTWGICGEFNEWGANPDIVMTRTATGTNATDGTWEADLTGYVEGKQFKLRWNSAWELDLGLKPDCDVVGDAAWDGYLEVSGQNIVLGASGNYHLVLNYPSCTFTATPIVAEP